jgi:hypothetical protein
MHTKRIHECGGSCQYVMGVWEGRGLNLSGVFAHWPPVGFRIWQESGNLTEPGLAGSTLGTAEIDVQLCLPAQNRLRRGTYAHSEPHKNQLCCLLTGDSLC